MRFTAFLITLIFSLASFKAKENSTGVWYTKTCKISFFSSTPIVDIKAVNNQSVLAFNQTTGVISAKSSIKSFVFPKKIMQEHFNENYMESDKFPYANFKGTIKNIESIDFSTDSAGNFSNPKLYNVAVEGDLTIHGETNKITTSATLKLNGKKVDVKSVFTVLLDDYKIEKPSVVALKIADKIEITIEGSCNEK